MYKPYDIADAELAQLLKLAEPDEYGCLPDDIDELEQRIADLLSEQYDRGEQICKAYLNHVRIAESIKAEEKRLKERRELEEEAAERLKTMLATCYGEGKNVFGAFTLQSRKSPPALKFANEAKTLEDFRASGKDEFIKVKYELDKLKLKEEIKKGLSVEGVTLESGVSWSIK